ncbi:MAG TPA: M20/M25/M40 family metallo-hydrolase [Trebonia sp.]|nr:M20/M25/M40 family metallo-hydrolase [Trebonia sp.]
MPRNSSWEAVDSAITEGAEAAFSFLERLVAAPSTVGQEMAAQQVVAAELDRRGFEVTALSIPAAVAERAPGGVAQVSYTGRPDILGQMNRGAAPSLLLNGHVDVVPADPGTWTSDPFTPVRRDGWLIGRGAGDMKGGFAMGLLAVSALRQAMPDAISGELGFLSVIEEECTGNGTLAACQQGVLGDAVVLLEPTDLGLMLGGTGVLWADVEVQGVSAHAESADRAVNPVDHIPLILRALASLEDELGRTGEDPAFADVARPYVVNPGLVSAGDWASSVPARARVGVRVGFPRRWSPDEALARLRAQIAAATTKDPWLSVHPPEVRASGFRAEGYLIDEADPLVGALAAAHAAAHAGAAPRRFVLGATTDARYYLNQFGVPAVAYGPRSRNIHGADEAVELASIVAGARTLARFIAAFFTTEDAR